MSTRRVWKKIFMILFVLGTLTVGHGQKITKCREEGSGDAPQYRVARTRRVVLDGVPILRLQISVGAEYFDRKYMIALAERLNRDFCNEKQLAVAICDDYAEAKASDLIRDLIMHHPHPGLRGGYNFNRAEGTRGISFSTNLDNRLKRVEVNSRKR